MAITCISFPYVPCTSRVLSPLDACTRLGLVEVQSASPQRDGVIGGLHRHNVENRRDKSAEENSGTCPVQQPAEPPEQ